MQNNDGEHIPPNNKGYKLLEKMGWKKGKGLGKYENGPTEPVRVDTSDSLWGLGKTTMMNAIHLEATSRSKRTLAETIAAESEESTLARQELTLKQQQVRDEIKNANKKFYCTICDKQYKMALEFDQHLGSYDHNHRKAFKEMKETMRKNESSVKRDKSHKLRDDAELNRIQKAAADRLKAKLAQNEATNNETDSKPKKVLFGFSNKPNNHRIGRFGLE